MIRSRALDKKATGELVLHGTGVSSGLVVAKAYCARRMSVEAYDRKITEEEVSGEMNRLEHALEMSKAQLRVVEADIEKSLGDEHSTLFDSYLMILDDPSLSDRMERIMREKLICAEATCNMAMSQLIDELSNKSDDYLRERGKDLQQIGERIIRNLLGVEVDLKVSEIPNDCILVAEELTPSETASLDGIRVLAFVTAGGSRTSHTAILARALGIPAIVGIKEGVGGIETGDELALDGDTGDIVVCPSKKTKEVFEKKARAAEKLEMQLQEDSQRPVETLDGYQACLVANVELPGEALSVRRKYNVGIGLFRTEFLFINGMNLQNEEEQFHAYKATVEAVKPYSVIFRTLDIGGDKFLNQLNLPHELNPFMGMRAIRFSLSQPEIFKVQLRAILRASAFGKVRMMFPMISTYDELDSALKILDEVKLELRCKRIPFNDDMDVGCMIEVPSAARIADKLLRRLTFFSLGTNDLVQYSLAVDRLNPTIGHLYQPANPAIIRMMKDVVDIATDKGRWVSVCGEMAGDFHYTPLILGLGIHELSMSPVSLPKVHKVIRCIKMYEAEQLVDYALGCDTCREVQNACQELINRSCAELNG